MCYSVGIVGSRAFTNFKILEEMLDRLQEKYEFTIEKIVSGGAPGADSLAVKYADKNEIGYTVFPAQWSNLDVKPCVIKYNQYNKPYNSMAGFIRNKDIVENSNLIIAFWDLKSEGTKDALSKAKRKNIPTLVVDVSDLTLPIRKIPVLLRGEIDYVRPEESNCVPG